MGNIQFYLSGTRIVLQCMIENVLQEALTELNPSKVAVALVLKKYTLPSHLLKLKTLLPAAHLCSVMKVPPKLQLKAHQALSMSDLAR